MDGSLGETVPEKSTYIIMISISLSILRYFTRRTAEKERRLVTAPLLLPIVVLTMFLVVSPPYQQYNQSHNNEKATDAAGDKTHPVIRCLDRKGC